MKVLSESAEVTSAPLSDLLIRLRSVTSYFDWSLSEVEATFAIIYIIYYIIFYIII